MPDCGFHTLSPGDRMTAWACPGRRPAPGIRQRGCRSRPCGWRYCRLYGQGPAKPLMLDLADDYYRLDCGYCLFVGGLMPPLCPAAYVRHPCDWPALAEAAARCGWPAPMIYCDGPGMAASAGLAVGRLQAAVSQGRHDGLLMPLPGMLGSPPWLMGLLRSCTRQGVTVSFVPVSSGPGRWPDSGWPVPLGEDRAPAAHGAAGVTVRG